MKPSKIFENYFGEYINLFPLCNDYLNISKYKHLKKNMENDLSLEHIKKQKTLYKKYIEITDNEIKKTHSKRNIIYLRTLNYICRNYLKSFKYNFDLVPISHDVNFINGIFEMSSGNSYYIFEKKQDYNDFIEKISIFPEIVDTIINNMRIGIKKNYVLPKLLSEKLYKQTVSILRKKTYLNKKIKVKLDYDYNKILEGVFLKKTTEFILFLKNEYIPKSRKTLGLCYLPNGKEEYKFLAWSAVTKNISIDKIHNFGLQEVERILKEQLIIKLKLGFEGTIKEFNKHLKKRKDLCFNSEKDLIESYKKIKQQIDRTVLKDFFSETINNKCLILSVPKHNEEYSSEAYYMPGDIEGKRKGKFYINLRNYKENSRIDMEALCLHEANPGHHFQITYNNESTDIPLFMKCYNNDAYTEGWGLYCEKLGRYKQLESYYGKLNMEMVRAIRLVVDTGIHYYGWSFSKTFNYMRRYLFETDNQINNQIYRYSAIPGQALSYKMGEKVILDLRSKYAGEIKKFHSKLLKYGQIPLDILVNEEFKF